MGFLYQVLKDVSEKQPYSVGKEELKNLVNDLESKLSTGREGFKVIAQVAERVREYNDKVKEGNNAVKKPIESLLTYVRDVGDGNLRTKIDAIQEEMITGGTDDKEVNLADNLLSECFRHERTFRNGVANVEEKYEVISNMNDDCRNKVNKAIEVIKHENDRLFVLARKLKDNNIVMENTIVDSITNLKVNIKIRIQEEVKQLVDILKTKVVSMQTQMAYIIQTLVEYVSKIDVWMQEATKLIDDARQNHAKKIATLETGRDERFTIAAKSLEVDKWRDALRLHIKNMKMDLKGRVVTALGKVKEMDKAVKTDLYQVKIQVDEKIRDYVSGYVGAVKNKVGHIMSGEDGSSGLQQILKQVETYVTQYGEDFGSKVEEWVTEVVKSEAGKGWLFWYVNSEMNQLKLVEPIKAEIMKIVSIDDTVTKPTVKDKLDETLQSIDDFLIDFAVALEEKAKGSELKGIASGMHRSLVASDRNTFAAASELKLQHALRDVLNAIACIAKHAGEQIGEVITSSHLENIDAALKNAKELDGSLKLALSRVVDAVDPRIYNPKSVSLDANIQKTISEALNDKIGTEDLNGDWSKFILSDLFRSYNKYVRITADTAETLTGNEGKLPEQIEAIKAKVDEINVDQIIKGLSDVSECIASNLHDITQAFAKAGADIDRFLSYLKEGKIGRHLASIKRKIETLQRQALAGVIGNAKSFVDVEADTECSSTIEALIKHVDQQISSALSTLTTAARRNYVSSIKALLTAFADKVEKELAGLPAEIDRDLTIGFKGLMKTLEDGDTKPNMEHFNINKLLDMKDLKNVENSSLAFLSFFTTLNNYVDQEIKRVNKENNGKHNPAKNDNNKYVDELGSVYTALNKFLTHITDQKRYNYKVPGLLDTLEEATSKLKPDTFENPNTAILDGIREGLREFIKELRKVYISTYDCAKRITWDGTFTNKEPEESKNAKKICLTVIYTLFHDLHPLFYQAAIDLKEQKIQGVESKMHLKDLLQNMGYNVDNLITRENTGRNVAAKLGKGFHQHGEFNEDPSKYISFDKYMSRYEGMGVVARIFAHLNDYYYVCHLATVKSPKQPCNIYQMLAWLCGLTYNPVYGDLSLNGFGGLFEKSKEDEEDADADGISLKVDDDETLAAYPADITATTLRSNLTAVCHSAYDILTAVLGHGHNDGVYASDYFNNNFNLSYPTSGSACLDMLVDILHRVHHQMGFLLKQCLNGPDSSGWKDCWYGRGVGGSSWKCNTKQCPKQIDGQACTQIANQRADQTCNQHPSCGLKSPLQSFLEDGLPGFLPHSFTKPGCKLECAVSNHRGLPCKTPMGFADISVTASHTKKGTHLAELLTGFCGKQDSPLVYLCAQLTCLMQRVPQTLDDMFSFYSNLLNDWNKNDTHRRLAFDNAVTKAYLNQPYDALQVYSIFSGGHSINHAKGDLFSLTCGTDSLSKSHCGRYLQPFSKNTWSVFSEKNADRYLTWITYLTETFYVLLKNIYDECCKNCATPGSRCYEKACYKNCVVSQSAEHHDKCKSIAACNFTRPTLCKYGFVLKSSSNLSGTNGNKTKRTCQDFCETLKNVLQKDRVLFTLAYKTIPDFLFKIRAPFIWLNVALWSLSLFYLIHIMVIRLDLLHIKSHLHSPSSHRIAAQSLLAAARVNKLNRVFYLQP